MPGSTVSAYAADVLDAELERAGERAPPIVDALTRRAVDEVDVHVVEPGAARERDRAFDVGRVVRAAERAQHVRRERLHTEREPVDAGRAVRVELLGVDAVGVALDRHLGVGGPVDRGEHAREAGAGSSEGVPPPKNTLVAGGRRSPRRRSRSVTSAPTYSSIRCARSVHVAKSQ